MHGNIYLVVYLIKLVIIRRLRFAGKDVIMPREGSIMIRAANRQEECVRDSLQNPCQQRLAN